MLRFKDPTPITAPRTQLPYEPRPPPAPTPPNKARPRPSPPVRPPPHRSRSPHFGRAIAASYHELGKETPGDDCGDRRQGKSEGSDAELTRYTLPPPPSGPALEHLVRAIITAYHELGEETPGDHCGDRRQEKSEGSEGPAGPALEPLVQAIITAYHELGKETPGDLARDSAAGHHEQNKETPGHHELGKETLEDLAPDSAVGHHELDKERPGDQELEESITFLNGVGTLKGITLAELKELTSLKAGR